MGHYFVGDHGAEDVGELAGFGVELVVKDVDGAVLQDHV